MTKHDKEQDRIIQELRDALNASLWSRMKKHPIVTLVSISTIVLGGLLVVAMLSGNPFKFKAEYGDARLHAETGVVEE